MSDRVQHAVTRGDTEQPCGHPWAAVVWLDEETCACGACLEEDRRQAAGACWLTDDAGEGGG